MMISPLVIWPLSSASSPIPCTWAAVWNGPLLLPCGALRNANDVAVRVGIPVMTDETLVAVIEVLSPSNKAGDDRGAYLLNRQAILQQPVHLLELDLLLKGRRLPTAAPLPKGDYFALLSRAGRRPFSTSPERAGRLSSPSRPRIASRPRKSRPSKS